MENTSVNLLTEEEQKQFLEFKRIKKEQEARAKVAKLECDFLSPYAEKSALKQLCKDGDRLGMGGIVVLPSMVKPCVAFLGRDPKCGIIAAISYPHGGDLTEVKAAAVKRAVKDGADEVEVCAPSSFLKDGNISYFKRECKKLKRAAKTRALRVCLDVAVLTDQEIVRAAACAADCGVNAVRISGFATSELIRTIKAAVKDKVGLKLDCGENAADYEQAVAVGATTVSCKSAVELATLILYEANQ
ncbi:MAG: hypothetical protein ACI4L9_00320 [Candidatus Coproplasma sp.]